MIDPFVLLAPILLMAVVGLLQFVGCDHIFGVVPTVLKMPANITLVPPLAENRNMGTDITIAATFPADLVQGNLVVVWLWYNSGTQHVSMVSDAASNQYQPAVGPTDGKGQLAGWRQEIWFAANVSAGTNVQVTATFDSSFDGERAMSAHQYSGAMSIDQTGNAAESSGNASVGPVPVSAGELVFAAAIFPPSAITPGAGTAQGFFQQSNLGDNVTEDKQFVGATDATATFTNDATQAWIAQLVTILPQG